MVETEKGRRVRLEFTEGREWCKLFDRADSLFVGDSTGWGKGLLYLLGPGTSLEAETGLQIRSATNVVKQFDKIAEVIERDRERGIKQVGWENARTSSVIICYLIP